MALPTCVRDILCGLSASVRASIASFIAAYVEQLTARKTFLTSKLLYLDILSAPPQLLNSLVQQFIAEVKAGANLIPLQLIGNCTEMGNLNAAIVENLNIILLDANIIANDLSRLLSFQDEVRAAIAEIEAALGVYNEVLAYIDACPGDDE